MQRTVVKCLALPVDDVTLEVGGETAHVKESLGVGARTAEDGRSKVVREGLSLEPVLTKVPLPLAISAVLSFPLTLKVPCKGHGPRPDGR